MLPVLALTILIAPVALDVTPVGFEKAIEPQIAIDHDHRAYIAYGMGNQLYLSTLGKGEKEFDRPTKVADFPNLMVGMRRGPRIAISGGTIVIAAVDSGMDGALRAYRSTNNGKSWQGPVTVNDQQGSAREGLMGLASAPNGTIACVWLDGRLRGTRLYYSESRDMGATWSRNRLVYQSPSGSICECCHPTIAFDSKNRAWIMFRNSLDGNRDMYLVGPDAQSAMRLGRDSWKLSACPMDGGMLAFNRDGEVRAIWRRESNVYLSGSGENETLIGPGKQPWIASDTKGFIAVWMDGNRILSARPGGDVQELSANGNDPVVCASPDGKLVLASWAEGGIRASVLSD
ncbi:MAG TPA: sialidase family protein [Fimbriimonadaceae bacterium]|nr:sialidase family protein [Fimbriimonadaceae bacterium]